MSILGSIMTAIFGHKGETPAAGSPAAPAPAGLPGARPVPAPAGSPSAAPSAGTSGVQPTAAPAAAPVDVAAILDKAAERKKEKLAWRTSIVDLMKILDLDSSLSARKELAKDLSYTGDTNDSAKMNIWLHQQVMRKLTENGGKVPDDLKS
jgi:hypothetical protein